MRSKFKTFVPVILLFIILNGFFISGKGLLQKWNADAGVLIGGNLLLFAITFMSFVLALRGLKSPNPHHFTRAVFSSIILKLFICMIAAFIYISTYQSNLNKPALFGCMGLYLVYTFLEVSILMKVLKSNTHG